MNKSTIRLHIAARRKSLTREEVEELSGQNIRLFLNLKEVIAAENILLYAALPKEVQTTPLLEKLSATKQIWLPKVAGDELEIRAYEGPDSLQRGHFNVPEPTGVLCLHPEKIDLVLVPGVAFARDGSRMGYGKGFYDRMLPHLRATKVGFAFDFQLFDQIPTETHDERMDLIVTSSGVITPCR
ncbi:MAG: 5-formyltetrahydrofolate cyclo-ligase [Bacteroidales bacterium]